LIVTGWFQGYAVLFTTRVATPGFQSLEPARLPLSYRTLGVTVWEGFVVPLGKGVRLCLLHLNDCCCPLCFGKGT
jgi:hypothetical protein